MKEETCDTCIYSKRLDNSTMLCAINYEIVNFFTTCLDYEEDYDEDEQSTDFIRR